MHPPCQLQIPLTKGYDSLNRLVLIGENWTVPQIMVVSNNSATKAIQGGVILESTIRGTADPLFGRGLPSVIGSSYVNDDFGPLNFTHVFMDNLTVRVDAGTNTSPLPASMTAVNLAQVAQCEVGHLMCDINISITNSVQPLVGASGFVTPAYNNRGYTNINALILFGYDFALLMSEHTYVKLPHYCGRKCWGKVFWWRAPPAH